MVEQSALYLSGGESTPAFNILLDSFVDLKGGEEIFGPDGKRALSLARGGEEPAFKLAKEGFWEVRRPNGQHELIAVHADRRESELETVPKETLALWQSTGKAGPEGWSCCEAGREALQHARGGMRLLLLLVAAVA